MTDNDVSFIKKQAKKGDAEAQNKLGVMYDKGEGVPQDYAKAAKWYRRAAEHGKSASAQYHLFSAYFIGVGVPENREEACKWCRLAADQGHPEARDAFNDVCKKENRTLMKHALRAARVGWSVSEWLESGMFGSGDPESGGIESGGIESGGIESGWFESG